MYTVQTLTSGTCNTILQQPIHAQETGGGNIYSTIQYALMVKE